MGVLMLSDSGGADGGCQYDVHGKELHPSGWPPVVQRVLKFTHSADYDPTKVLPDTDFRETMAALEKLRSAYRTRVTKEESRSRGGRGGGGSELKRSKHKRWGFKAPVSMYLVPFWARVFPGCTFVHVVRDGRDMSFHWLQSPVKRYWPHLFPDHLQALPPKMRRESALIPDKGSYAGKAYMYDVPTLNKAPHFRISELWSKSNLEVLRAGKRYSSPRSRIGEITNGFGGEEGALSLFLGGFLTIRSEDFVTTRPRYFAASSSLLRVVRPELTTRDICCIVASHWDAEQKSPGWKKNVQNYGKWRQAVEKHGGVSQSAEDPESLYGGILLRAKAALERFQYAAFLQGGSSRGALLSQTTIGEFNYSNGLEPHSCGDVTSELDCPGGSGAVHQQKCL